jgi:predicted nuclease of predicted toxin-antitoxin system
MANKLGAVVITKDRDFTPTEETVVRVIWVRTGNISTRALIDRFEIALPMVVSHLSDGARLVELR